MFLIEPLDDAIMPDLELVETKRITIRIYEYKLYCTLHNKVMLCDADVSGSTVKYIKGPFRIFTVRIRLKD
jgi:hypothetical protein